MTQALAMGTLEALLVMVDEYGPSQISFGATQGGYVKAGFIVLFSDPETSVK